ncbi:MAG: DUF4369 domain-containing protein [Bacteroidales bacterium]|nr:DUF4369 domain-containing protein [Bacteroidales bacterium]
MKKLLYILILLSIFSCNQEEKSTNDYNFTISGNIKNAPLNTVIKLYRRTTNNIEIQDSVILTNEKFELHGTASELDFFVLELSSNNNYIYLLADSNDNIILQADFNSLKNYEVQNSVHSELIQELENNLYQTNLKIDEAINQRLDFSDIVESQINFSVNFINRYDTSLSVIIAFSEKFLTGATVLPIDSFYNAFKKAEVNLAQKYSNIEHYKQFCKFIKNYEVELIRNQPITQLQTQPTELQDFSATTITGKNFSLSSLAGNWILLNFWASWSPGAYLNNITIKKIRLNFSAIKIVQISIDVNEQILKDTLKNYNFDHILINDVLGWSSPITNLYAVDMLPTFILIAPNKSIELFTNNPSELYEKINKIIF